VHDVSHACHWLVRALPAECLHMNPALVVCAGVSGWPGAVRSTGNAEACRPQAQGKHAVNRTRTRRRHGCDTACEWISSHHPPAC
jgi:hypothetical protein